MSPKESTKTTKRLIKRHYGVSVTDLDAYGENVSKGKKKKVENIAKKKIKNGEVNNKSKARSAQTKTTANSKDMIMRTDNSQRPDPMDSSVPTISNDDNIFHCSSSISLQEPMDQSFASQPTAYVLHELRNASASTCGRCYCSVNLLYTGGYCSQCNIPICNRCWPKECFNIYYCTICSFPNDEILYSKLYIILLHIHNSIYLFTKFSHDHPILLFYTSR